MAQDGLWYPPRQSKDAPESETHDSTSRWARGPVDPDGETDDDTGMLFARRRIVEAAVGGDNGGFIELRDESHEREAFEMGDVSEVKIDGESAVDAKRVEQTANDEKDVVDLRAIDEQANEEQPARVSSGKTAAGTIPLAESMATKMAMPRTTIEGPVRGDSDRADSDKTGRLIYLESDVDLAPTEPDGVSPQTESGQNDWMNRRRGRAIALLTVAAMLAVTSGILGALWVRERSTSADLRTELSRSAIDPNVAIRAAELESLQDEIGTLRLQNQDLERRVQELTAIVPEVPVGRVSTVDIPLDFQPAFVGEVQGSFIAVSGDGQFVVWADGVDGSITDSGTVDGDPLGLVALRDVSWVPTSDGFAQLLSMNGGEDPEPLVLGRIELLTRSSRTMWGYAPATQQLQRFRQTNGRVLTTVDLPTPARSITAGAGAVWVLGDNGVVYRVNTADFTLSPLAAGEEIVSIAAGADALWSLSAADGSLRRLDAVSGEVLVTVPVGRDPIAAVVSGNSVWVALRSGSKLIEVDTRTSAVVSRTDLPGVPLRLTRGETGVLVTLEGDTPLVRVASVVPDVADAELDGADDVFADGGG